MADRGQMALFTMTKIQNSKQLVLDLFEIWIL